MHAVNKKALQSSALPQILIVVKYRFPMLKPFHRISARIETPEKAAEPANVEERRIELTRFRPRTKAAADAPAQSEAATSNLSRFGLRPPTRK
jgi:hypothetical protein